MDRKNNMFRAAEKQFSSGWDALVGSCDEYIINWCIKCFTSHTEFPQNVALLEEEDDVNQLTEYFSYEHFYVIYCKFWELDTDHDLYIDQRDMARHNDQGSRPVFFTKKTKQVVS